MNANVRKTNTGKILVAAVVLAIIVCAFAALMPASETDAAPANTDPTYLGGSITATQEFGEGTIVVVNDNLTIPAGMALVISSGATFTVNEGSTITINQGGQLIFQGTPTVTINGSIVASGAPTVGDNNTVAASGNTGEYYYYAAIINNTTYTAANGGNPATGIVVNGSILVERGATIEFMSVSGTKTYVGFTAATTKVALDATGSDTSGDILLNNGASLDITQRSRYVSTIAHQDIMMGAGSDVNINGIINGTVTIQAQGAGTYYTAGSVTLTNDTAEIAEGMSASDLSFTVTTENRTAVTTSGSEDTITLRQYILNVDGTVGNGDELSTTAGTYSATNTFYEPTGYGYKLVPIVSITGTLEIGAGSDFTVAVNSQLNVSGTLSVEYDEDMVTGTGDSATNANGTTTIAGSMFVTGTVSGYYYTTGTGDNVYTSFEITHTAASEDDTNSNYNRIVVDGGSIEITTDATLLSFLGDNATARLYGSVYLAEATSNNADDVIYIVDFDDAVAGAIAAEADEVYVYAFGTQNYQTSEEAIERGAYVVESDISIPDNMTVNIWNSMVVAEGVTLTVEDGGAIEIADGSVRNTTHTPGVLWVLGEVVDYDGYMDSYEGSDFSDSYTAQSSGIMKYEVRKITDTDTEYYVTYTTLANAIAGAQSGETIELNNKVTITNDLRIPAEVTVVTDSDITSGVALEIQGATLTIDGTLELTAGQKVAITADADNANRMGSIVLNNIIADANTTTFQNSAGTATPIAGVYFNAMIGDDVTSRNYVTSAAVAAANSAATSKIDIYGDLAMGTVTFTQGEDQSGGLSINIMSGDVTGDITLVGTQVTFAMTGIDSTYSGSVTSDVTAGTTSVDFSRSSGITVSITSADDGSTVTTKMSMNGTLAGTATVSSGAVEPGTNLRVGDYDGESAAILTIGADATLNVLNGQMVTIASTNATGDNVFAGLVIDGTIVVNQGTLNIGNGWQSNDTKGQVEINGTANIQTSMSLSGIIYVNGAFNVVDGQNTETTVTVSNMYVGDADGVAGTLSGNLSIVTNGFIVVYPDADIANAAIQEDSDGQTAADVTEYYINGELYMTSYTMGTVKVNTIVTSPLDLVGYEPIYITDNADTTDWFSDAEMTKAITTSTNTSDVRTAYAEADLSDAMVYVSVGSNMSVFIDDVRYSNGAIVLLTVGEHSISVQVNPGYNGTTSVTFNGAAVTGGTFTVTPELADEYDGTPSTGTTPSDCVVLSVTGQISQDVPVISGSDSGDSGMGLTDYLLIILVILIVIMAIMVAMRLMRS